MSRELSDLDPKLASESMAKNKVVGVAEHDQRYKLHNEMHVGACELVDTPAQISHLVLLSDNSNSSYERELITQLCQRYGSRPPEVHSNYFSEDFGLFRLRWERHTEYSTYSFFHSAPVKHAFAEPVIKNVPEEWLERLPGKVIAATHITVLDNTAPRPSLSELKEIFAPNTVIGAEVAAGSAIAWTDNKIHKDGFSRILIHDVNLRRRQAGRLVQRLLEIETYRMLAMLAVPLMRSYIPQLAKFDEQLAELTEFNINLECLEDEQALLERLTDLAAKIEGISARTSQRYNASSMYYDITRLRISELRERRIQGLQMFKEFMEQRLSPAMSTCALVNNKLETLAKRVEQASSLLRTRVEISMEKQSRDLLQSMDQRAKMQLRLQETVEGLSIVVLSYYLLGLVSYGLKSVKAAGMPINVDIATGVAIPFVVFAVFFSVRRFKRLAQMK